MVAFAEREAEVFGSFLAEASSVLVGLAAQYGLDVRRVLDIGCGPGFATCVLAGAFPNATVTAADGSAEMLANVAARAERLDLSERVETRVVELPDGLAGLGQADLAWASMVVHHVGDEAAALRGLRERLDQGGLLALVEFGDPLRFLPDDADLGRPGVWDRLEAARATWLADMRAGLPGAAPSTDYPSMLEAVGFDVVVDRFVDVHLDPPLDGEARRLALDQLKRLREHVEPYVDPADMEVIDVLVDEEGPAGILRRDDAILHTSRHLFVARAK